MVEQGTVSCLPEQILQDRAEIPVSPLQSLGVVTLGSDNCPSLRGQHSGGPGHTVFILMVMMVPGANELLVCTQL